MEQKEDLPTNQENKIEITKEEQGNTEDKKTPLKISKKSTKKTSAKKASPKKTTAKKRGRTIKRRGK